MFCPHIAAVPEHVGRVAIPFAVLLLCRLLGCYLPLGYEGLQLLHSADYTGSRVLAERHARHRQIDVLQLYCLGVDRLDETPCHSQEVLVTTMQPFSMSVVILHRLPSCISMRSDDRGVERIVEALYSVKGKYALSPTFSARNVSAMVCLLVFTSIAEIIKLVPPGQFDSAALAFSGGFS